MKIWYTVVMVLIVAAVLWWMGLRFTPVVPVGLDVLW